MKIAPVYFALIILLIGLPLSATPDYTFSEVNMVPMGSLQLGETALVSPEVFQDLNVEMGQFVRLDTGSGKSIDVLLYPIKREKHIISLKKSLRDALEVSPGEHTVNLTIIAPEDTELEKPDHSIKIKLNMGEPEKWPHMVLGAPHGDCDLFTGEVAELATEISGIPSVGAYGGRISYIGRWIDVNRPLQREPAEVSGIKPYRAWTDEAYAVYSEYRDKMLVAGRADEAPKGEVPLDFYLDFHGHDLTVTLPDGTRKPRNVCEAMARGFTLEEVRELKKALNDALRAEYGDDAPPVYWGNLPEDRVYTEHGVEVSFFYSGLGGRVYGALNSGYSRKLVHIETPNLLRVPEDNRIKTARVWAAFFEYVRDNVDFEHHSESRDRQADPELWDNKIDWLLVPGGEFTMGADENEGWSSQRPQRRVKIAEFMIAATEITNNQYVEFVNANLSEGKARFDGDSVVSKSGDVWIDLWPSAPLSGIERQGNVVKSRSSHEVNPVVEVSWQGAVAFAEYKHARLPTEAEWEYMAGWDHEKGAADRWRESGDPEYKNLRAGVFMHHENGEKAHNAPAQVGLHRDGDHKPYDTVGNVWEWTSDWYGDYIASDELVKYPRGPESGTMKVIRGGAWDTEPSTTTPVFRLGVAPGETLPTVGFRLARDWVN